MTISQPAISASRARLEITRLRLESPRGHSHYDRNRDIPDRTSAVSRPGRPRDRAIAGVCARTGGTHRALSNYGSIAERDASPIALPPTVVIAGAERVRKEVVPTDDKPGVL